MTRRRTLIVAGNWKMNMTCAETVNYLSKLLYSLEILNNLPEVIIFPPFTAIRSAHTFLSNEKNGSIIKIGAQNMHWEEKGAFTGEISPLMLKELGVTHVILGHSERRHIFGETDEVIIRKIDSAIRHEIKPVICVGETLEEREEGKTEDVLERQLLEALRSMKSLDYRDFIIAYEPVWAIGTGVSASPEQAEDACRFIRALVGSVFDPEFAKNVRILYGGSVSPENFREFIIEPDIDGGLVGTASLSPEKFFELIRIAVANGEQ